MALLGPNVRRGGWYATSGINSATIESTWLPVIEALPVNDRPQRVMTLLLTNDLGGTGGAFNLTNAMTTVNRIYDRLILAGAVPIVCTELPRNDTVAVNALVDMTNAALTRNAHRRGLQVVDLHKVVTDPATGLYRSGYNADGTHPSPAGFKAMALAVKAELAATLMPSPFRLTDNKLDNLTMLKKPLSGTVTSNRGTFHAGGGRMDGVVGNANVGDGWSLTYATPTLTTRTGFVGGVQKIVGSGTLQTYDTLLPVVGNEYQFGFAFETVGVEAAGGNYTISVTFVNASNAAVGSALTFAYQWPHDMGQVCYMSAKTAPAPATAVNMRFTVTNASASEFYLGQVTVDDVTALGY
jgi:lysophospholipase L1-like esterase